MPLVGMGHMLHIDQLDQTGIKAIYKKASFALMSWRCSHLAAHSGSSCESEGAERLFLDKCGK
jgi:hypothetical protein